MATKENWGFASSLRIRGIHLKALWENQWLAFSWVIIVDNLLYYQLARLFAMKPQG